MAYQIEVLTINRELVLTVQRACDSLNKVQDEFRFEIPKEDLRANLYRFKREEYRITDLFQIIGDYKFIAKGHRPFIILVIDGFLEGNLFGTITAARDVALFTTHDFDQFINDKVRFCRYYLVRYAINFLAPLLKSHDLAINKDCIFHYKRRKSEITLSLNSGHICDDCRNIIQPKLTSHIDDAIKKLLLVVSNQHPYSIILKGGGVKGLAFAGALLELEKFFSFDGFAGTSAGSIAALLLGAGFKPKEILEEMSNKNFRDFKDASWLKALFINLPFKKGLFPGDEIENWLANLLKKKIKKENEVLLSDLQTHTILYASRIKDGTLLFDSQGDRKTAHAAYAARCSMSIPIYFTPKLEDGVKVYDGGLRNNFPLKRFIEDNKHKPFIGLYLKSSTKKSWFVLNELFNMTIDGEEMNIVDENLDKIVIIDTHPIKTTNFNLSKKKKEFLILSGRVAALQFIERNFPDINLDSANLSKIVYELEELRKTIKVSF